MLILSLIKSGYITLDIVTSVHQKIDFSPHFYMYVMYNNVDCLLNKPINKINMASLRPTVAATVLEAYGERIKASSRANPADIFRVFGDSRWWKE